MSQISDTTSSQNAVQRLQDSYESERTENRANHERDLQKTKSQSESEVTRAKNEYSERLESEKSTARDEVRKLKEELYSQKGKTSSSDSRELNEERKQLSQFRDQIKAEATHQHDKGEQSLEQRSRVQKSQEGDKVEQAISAQKKSQRQEVKDLEDELAQYKNLDHDVSSDRAKAKQQALSENESSQIDEKTRIIDAYERQIARMKDHDVELQDHYDRRLTDSAFESNAKNQNQLRRQKEEFIQEYRNVDRKEAVLEDSFKTELKSERAKQVKASDHLITKNTADLDHAVSAKDEAYRKYLATQNEQVNYQLASRDEKIKELQTTSDPLKVSPFVVKKINDSVEGRYYAQLNEATAVNEKNLSATRDRDSGDRRAMLEEYQGKLTGATRGSRKELDQKNKTFLNAYDDLNHLHAGKQAALVEQKRGVTERFAQKSAVELANAEKQKLEALDEQHEALVYEKSSALDDASQSHRNQEREWAMKTNDVRRNLETQMAEERDQHEKVVSEIKLEFDKKLRDQDRTSKRSMDERVRNYEHQIQQQELSFKEKERFLTEHYEEELDTVKRTNAHLIQKKS